MIKERLSLIRKKNGVTLIELMIVVAIIGLLATIAFPKLKVFQAKALQAEAKSNLSHIFTLQTAYEMESQQFAILCSATGTQRYGMQLTGDIIPSGATSSCNYAGICAGGVSTNFLGFNLNGCAKVRYGYYANASTTSFSAIARSQAGDNNVYSGCTTVDVHTINQTQTTAITSDVTKICN